MVVVHRQVWSGCRGFDCLICGWLFRVVVSPHVWIGYADRSYPNGSLLTVLYPRTKTIGV